MTDSLNGKPLSNTDRIAQLERQQYQLLLIIEYMAKHYTPWHAEDSGVVIGMLKSLGNI